ncbi:MAG: glutathione-disulfide reductase, partial [Rhodobacteraceae bacterium]|nr:glutathione-disulfide reductase [Paracoccaceae bacterium]
MKPFDLFVIGGGSGGIRAARLVAEMGHRVGLAEQSRLGGTCVIRGCVPKKLMYYAAGFADSLADAAGFGWHVPKPAFALGPMKAARDVSIDRLEKLYARNLAASGVTCFATRARVRDHRTVELASGETLRAEVILIATGGQPYVPDFAGSDLVATSDDLFELRTLPERILVNGGGYIACEFAGILNGMGSTVTQYYRGDQILRGFDDSLRNEVHDAMRKRGIDIRLGLSIQSIVRREHRYVVTDSEGASSTYDLVLSATGRRPATKDLGLETSGITTNGVGAIDVDAYSQTSVKDIYAVGDATNRLNLTPVAIREAMAFVETVFCQNPMQPNHANVATAVFTRPEIGTVGLSEADAARDHAIAVYETRFMPMVNTLAARDEYSYMKLVVAREDDRVLGVHILGPAASEMIQLAAV